MAPRKRVTIKDVAAATGLSPAAVSYAMRGLQTSQETQERVRRAADDLGYTGNAVARALARGRTGSSACSPGRSRTSASSASSRRWGASSATHELQMMLVDAQGDPEREGAIARQLADQLVDGLVVSALNPADPVWEEIGDALPVVTVGDALSGTTVGEVLFDNRAGVTMVLEHLHELGHRRIAVLTPSRPSTPDRPAERVVGEACRALGLVATVVNTRHSIDDAAEAASGLLRSEPRPTAVFCLSDSIACGVYAAAAAYGLAIPGELSVAGYDGHPIARAVTPQLTTVEWGMTDVATAAAGMLSDALGGGGRPRARVRVAPELIARASTAPPAA